MQPPSPPAIPDPYIAFPPAPPGPPEYGGCYPNGEGSDVSDMQGNLVGSMGKAFRGCDELLTQTNKFWVDFPTNATPQEKALLIGSVFLIDFEYFEVKKN